MQYDDRPGSLSFLYLIIILSLAACSTGTSNQIELDDLGWIEGQWISEDAAYREEWRRSDQTFVGRGLTITNNDTVFNEKLTISRNQGTLTYWALIPGQNNDQPVGFELTGATTDSLVFENPEHDFPNRISYVKKGEDELFVRVEENSGEKGFNINLQRIK
jgi:hypothetical protein